MSYQIIATHKGEDVVFYREYGCYQGTFILVTEKEGVLRIYKNYFGSCSGCDSYQATFNWDDEDAKGFIASDKVANFVAGYKPFLERNIAELTYEDVYDGVTMNNKDEYDFNKEDQKKLIDAICTKYFILPTNNA